MKEGNQLLVLLLGYLIVIMILSLLLFPEFLKEVFVFLSLFIIFILIFYYWINKRKHRFFFGHYKWWIK